jgi:hypothetical protein
MHVDHSSSPVAVSIMPSDRDAFLPLLRWLILGVALGLCILALSHADAVGAQAPANCNPINQTSCLSNGVIYTNGTATANIGLPNSVVLPGYIVPGIAYPSYGYGSYVGANFLPNFGGYYNNLYTENYGYLGTNCDPKAWWCLNYEYTGDVFSNLFAPGPVVAVPGMPASAPAGAVNPSVTYHPAEVAQPAVTAQPAAQPAAPAPAAQMATALNAPAQTPAVAAAGGTNVKILSVQTTTAPLASNDGRDDGK